MKDIQKQPFYDNLNDEFISKVEKLITKTNQINLYKKIQLRGTIAIMISSLVYFSKDILEHTFSFDSMDFYLCVLLVGVFFLLIEKMAEPIKTNLKETSGTVKNKMIVKICSCNGYCNCKDEFNTYIEKRGIKILN